MESHDRSRAEEAWHKEEEEEYLIVYPFPIDERLYVYR